VEAVPVVAVVEEAPPEPEHPKALLGPYELLEPVEAGRYYEVLMGRDPATGARVLITVFSTADERGRSALLSSLLPLGVDHPNVIRLLDFGRCPQGCWVATEYAGARTLRDLIGVGPERQPAPTDRVLALIVQVCEGLQALHQRHVFHRNLKPSNILIDAEAKSAKIIDFQIAVSLRGRDQVTQVAGTLPYMAKEVLEGHADQRADIYSVGVMLYELLTGKLPFWAASQRALVEQISSLPAAEPKSLNPALPEYLNDAILRALSKDPARRFQTAAELRDALVEGEPQPEPESWLRTITPESTAP
jgi:eukaryotic-like serine/threonine-protein kinase